MTEQAPTVQSSAQQPLGQPVAEGGAFLGMPIGRVVALITPIAATVMGGLAAWLFEHFPGLNTIVPEDTASAALTTGVIWVVTAALTYAISHKWLDGLSKWERGVVADIPGDQSLGLPTATVAGDELLADEDDLSDEPDEDDWLEEESELDAEAPQEAQALPDATQGDLPRRPGDV